MNLLPYWLIYSNSSDMSHMSDETQMAAALEMAEGNKIVSIKWGKSNFAQL